MSLKKKPNHLNPSKYFHNLRVHIPDFILTNTFSRPLPCINSDFKNKCVICFKPSISTVRFRAVALQRYGLIKFPKTSSLLKPQPPRITFHAVERFNRSEILTSMHSRVYTGARMCACVLCVCVRACTDMRAHARAHVRAYRRAYLCVHVLCCIALRARSRT